MRENNAAMITDCVNGVRASQDIRHMANLTLTIGILPRDVCESRPLGFDKLWPDGKRTPEFFWKM